MLNLSLDSLWYGLMFCTRIEIEVWCRLVLQEVVIDEASLPGNWAMSTARSGFRIDAVAVCHISKQEKVAKLVL